MICIYFLSFATSNWKQSKLRYIEQLDVIQKNFNLFKDIYLYNENDLDSEYWKYIENKITVKDGYYLWSWKPYIILNTLNKINDGDYLLYMDGGCSLYDYKNFETSKNILTEKCFMLNENVFIALNHINPRNCPIKIQIRKDVLEDLNLSNDNYFLNEFPHYQANVILLYKCDKCVNFIYQWLKCFDLYHKSVNHRCHDKKNQLGYFYRNNGDQGFLQALLYKNNTKVLDIQEYKKYVKRIKK